MNAGSQSGGPERCFYIEIVRSLAVYGASVCAFYQTAGNKTAESDGLQSHNGVSHDLL